MAHGALEHEATKASRVVAAAVDNGLHRVGDGIHHRVHGRNRGRHLLPSGVLLPYRSVGQNKVRDNVLDENGLVE
jgi:hypothetical protein